MIMLTRPLKLHTKYTNDSSMQFFRPYTS